MKSTHSRAIHMLRIGLVFLKNTKNYAYSKNFESIEIARELLFTQGLSVDITGALTVLAGQADKFNFIFFSMTLLFFLVILRHHLIT